MIDKQQALEIIDKRDFFNDRAGRELWNDKPKEIQDEDIINDHEEYEQLKEYILNQRRNRMSVLKAGIVRKFICAISLFTAAVLFMLLLLMLKYGYGFIQVVCVLATPIVLSYVIFLLVFIGFVLMDF